MEKSLNARPAKSLNQRPSANARPVVNKYPTPGNQPQPKTMPGVQPAAKPAEPVRAATASAAPVRQAAPVQSSEAIPELVRVMREMVGSFAILSEEVIAKNVKLASDGGMSNGDRTISFECADYLMTNFGCIIMGLVCDKAFKDAFMEALLVEIKLDEQTEDVKKKTREAMRADLPYDSNGSIIIGLTTFVPSVQQGFMDKIQASFEALDDYADEFDNTVNKLTGEEKTEYGFIFSNFMYLIRAFTHNNMFMSYVITVVEKVKALLMANG